MADSRSELMKMMKQEKARQGRLDDRDFYTKLRIFPQRRRVLWTCLVLAFCAFAVLLMMHQGTSNHWLVVAGPHVLIGSFLVLIPPTEEWRYSSWQSYPQRYERHIVD